MAAETEPMRILFVGSHRADKQFSIMGFEKALEQHLSARCDFRVIIPGNGSTTQASSKWARYFEKYIVFPRELRAAARQADIVHFCENGVALNVPHVSKKTTLVTVHDFLAVQASLGQFEGWEVGWSGKQLQKRILKALGRASALASVSETTLGAIRHFMPDYHGETRVILNSTYKVYHRVSREEALGRLGSEHRPVNEPFFFHIGGNKPYKNRKAVLAIYAAFRNLEPDTNWGLIMAGGPKNAELTSMEAELGLTGKVQWIAEPSDTQVEALYSIAGALIFPSLAEGFGLPILEAQACGCPVFATNKGPLTEVGGDSVVYFDPTNPESAAHTISQSTPNLSELSEKGLQNILRFDQSKMADGYFRFYQDLLTAKA